MYDCLVFPSPLLYMSVAVTSHSFQAYYAIAIHLACAIMLI